MEEEHGRERKDKGHEMLSELWSGIEDSGIWGMSNCIVFAVLSCHNWVRRICSGISGKLKSYVDFHCKRCLEGGPDQARLLRDVEIESNVMLESVSNCCYFGDTLGENRSVEKAAQARVRCARVKYRELSPFWQPVGLHMKEMIYKACVQSLLTYQTWTMKAENLHSLVRAT